MPWSGLAESLNRFVEKNTRVGNKERDPKAEYGLQQRKRTPKTPLYRNLFFILQLSLRLAFEILALSPWGSPGCFDGMERALFVDGRARNRKRRTERWYNWIFGIRTTYLRAQLIASSAQHPPGIFEARKGSARSLLKHAAHNRQRLPPITPVSLRGRVSPATTESLIYSLQNLN
jgi:hypothetical protein